MMSCLCSATKYAERCPANPSLYKYTARKSLSEIKLPPQMSTTYRVVAIIDSGAYGTTYKVVTKDGFTFALKIVEIKKKSATREGEIMRDLNCEYCVKSYYVLEDSNNLYIIMDYIPSTLENLTKKLRSEKKRPDLSQIKQFAFQMFTGLAYLHKMGIVHRDIKPDNLLINEATNSLKIGDFGLAKIITSASESSFYIGNRFYRAPELIYECTTYRTAVDIWSAGCVLAEMVLLKPLFYGSDTNDQRNHIIKYLGPPSDDDFSGFEYSSIIITAKQTHSIRSVMPAWTPPELVDLLEAILVYNPDKRPTAEQCLQFPYFT